MKRVVESKSTSGFGDVELHVQSNCTSQWIANWRRWRKKRIEMKRRLDQESSRIWDKIESSSQKLCTLKRTRKSSQVKYELVNIFLKQNLVKNYILLFLVVQWIIKSCSKEDYFWLGQNREAEKRWKITKLWHEARKWSDSNIKLRRDKQTSTKKERNSVDTIVGSEKAKSNRTSLSWSFGWYWIRKNFEFYKIKKSEKLLLSSPLNLPAYLS